MLKIEDFQFFQRSINSSNDQQNEQSTTVLAELTEHKKNHDIWRWKSKSWHKDVWIYDTLIKVICIITETWLQVFAMVLRVFVCFVLFCFVFVSLLLFLCCFVWFFFAVFSRFFVCPVLPVSLDCPFLIATSVFSNVFIIHAPSQDLY